MGAFRSDMASLWRNVSVMGVHLSEDMTALIEERVKDFDALSGSADALEQLEASMLGPLCQHVQQADCSGGFVLLSVSLNPDADDRCPSCPGRAADRWWYARRCCAAHKVR